VRKAFKVAQTEKPGATFIYFPENIAEMKVYDCPVDYAENIKLTEKLKTMSSPL